MFLGMRESVYRMICMTNIARFERWVPDLTWRSPELSLEMAFKTWCRIYFGMVPASPCPRPYPFKMVKDEKLLSFIGFKLAYVTKQIRITAFGR